MLYLTPSWHAWRSDMKKKPKRLVSLVDALNHARTREIASSMPNYPGETVTFTDGSVVICEHEDGWAYSEYTQESGSTTFWIVDAKEP